MANVDGYAMFYQAGRTCPVNCPMRCSDTNYVTKITHWQGGSCTRAVEMEWSDGTVQTAGTKDGDVSTATFSEPFLIYRAWLSASNYRDGRFDGLKLWTTPDVSGVADHIWGGDGDTHVDVSFPEGSQFFGYDIWAGADIDSLTLVVSPQLLSYEWVDVVYDLSKQTITTVPNQIATVMGINGDSIQQAIVLSSSQSVADQASIADNYNGKGGFGFKLTNAAKTFEFNAATEGSQGRTSTKTETTTKTVTANLNIIIPAFSKTTAACIASTNTTTVPFSGTVLAKYTGGHEKRTNDSGIFTNVEVTNFVLQIGLHEPLSEAEKTAHVGFVGQAN